MARRVLEVGRLCRPLTIRSALRSGAARAVARLCDVARLARVRRWLSCAGPRGVTYAAWTGRAIGGRFDIRSWSWLGRTYCMAWNRQFSRKQARIVTL